MKATELEAWLRRRAEPSPGHITLSRAEALLCANALRDVEQMRKTREEKDWVDRALSPALDTP